MRDYSYLTPSQKQAIFYDNGNLLVSASAGSGKTHVVIERIIRLVTEKNVGIDRILAVTFTNLAASEMKEKLKKALILAFNESGDVRYKYELEKISMADISTIHSFCLNLLKKYFYKLGIDASFEVLDAKKCKKLQGEAMSSLFEALYGENDSDFTLLVNLFGGKRNDKGLRKIISGIYSFALNDLGLESLKEKTLNSHLNLLEIIKEDILPSVNKEAQSYLDAFNNILRLLDGDEKRVEICNKAIVLASSLSLTSNLFEFSKLYCGFELKLTSSKPKNKAVADEFKNLINDFKGFYSTILNNFNVSEEEAKIQAQQNVKIINALFDVANRYSEYYTQLKNEENGVDFSDLEVLTYKLLQNEDIAQEVKTKYDYVFVDEYQDVNAIQEKIISKIINDNAFLVGDSKQSIYAFRGCNPKFFIDKYESYKNGIGGSAISLDYNFRSAKNIIDLTNKVFSDVFTTQFSGFDYAKNPMVYGNGYADFKGETVIHLIEDDEKEVEEFSNKKVYSVIDSFKGLTKKEYGKQEILTVNLVRELLKTTYYDIKEPCKDKRIKPVDFKDICILVRGVNGYGEAVVSALYDAGIPVSSSATSEISQYPEIKALFDAVNAIIMPQKDIPFASFMLNFGGFNETELASIRKFGGNDKSFYDCVTFVKNSSQEISKKVADFITWYEKLRLIAEYAKASEILYKIIGETGFTTKLYAMEFGNERVKRVERFISESVLSNKSMTLLEFSNYLSESIDEITQTQTAGENTVTVMTEHASKGLEFPIVIIADFNKQFNSSEILGDVLYSKKYGIVPKNYNLEEMTYSENLLRFASKVHFKEERAVEEARLFYVAITRAKCALHFIANSSSLNKRKYSTFKIADKQKCFLDENDAEIIIHNSSEFDFNKKEEGIAVMGSESDAELTKLIQKNLTFKYSYYEDTVMPLKRSVSEVNKSDAQDYYETTNLFGLSNTETGTAYHKFFQLCNFYGDSCQKQMQSLLDSGKITSEEASLIDVNNLDGVLKMPIFTKIKDYELKKEQRFCALFDAKKFGYNTSNEEILIQGVFDLVAIKGGRAILIDYKYSTIKNDDDLIKNYKTQMQLYKEAIEKSSNLKVDEVYLINVLQLKCLKLDV